MVLIFIDRSNCGVESSGARNVRNNIVDGLSALSDFDTESCRARFRNIAGCLIYVD